MSKLWKWSKRLLWLLAGLFVLLIISVSILVYLINSESFLESQIQKQLGMSSQVGELDVSIFSGTATIAATRIGPQDEPAIRFDKLTAQLSYAGLFRGRLLVESVTLDNASIRYPFDYRLAAGEAAQEEDDSFFFDQLDVAEIRITNSNFSYQDALPLEATGINLTISHLPVAKNGIFLFDNLSNFFNASQTTLVASVERLATDKSQLNQLTFEGKIENDSIEVATLASQSATLVIDLSQYQAESSNSEPDNELLDLPFKDLWIHHIRIGKTHIELVDEQPLTLDNLALTFSELLLVKDQSPLWLDWHNFYQQQNSRYRLSSDRLTSDMLQYQRLELGGRLQAGNFVIEQLALTNPQVTYSTNTEPAEPTAPTTPTDTNASLQFPFNSLRVDDLTITGGELALSMAPDTGYKVSMLEASLQQLSVIEDQRLVIAEPKQWPQKVRGALDTAEVELPEGKLKGVSAQFEADGGAVWVTPLRIESADLNITRAEEAAIAEVDKSAELPVHQLTISNLTAESVNAEIALADDELTLRQANLSVSSLPLIIEGALLAEQHLASMDTSYQLSVAAVSNSQMSLTQLASKGRLKDNSLMIETLSSKGAKLRLNLEQASANAGKRTNEPIRLPINRVQLQAANLQDIDANIRQQVTKPDAAGELTTEWVTTDIKDASLRANQLLLVNNHRLINDWYDTQLAGAFAQLELNIGQIQQDDDRYSDIAVKAVQANRTIVLNPLRVTVNDATLTADWSIDLAQAGYLSDFKFAFQDLSLKELTRTSDEEGISLNGKLSGVAEVTFKGLRKEQILSSLNGQVQISNSSSIQLANLNINKVLERFLESQEFGLLDVGGFLLAGPAGLLVSQGVSVQGVLSNLGADAGDTLFGQLNVDMVIENGVLKTQDVAASTQKYRFAFDGNIDLSIMAFNDFEFMILNDEGCKEYSQTLNGSLTAPEIETFRTAFDAVTGSVVGLFKSGVDLITGGYCESVYDGKVTHPETGVEIPHPEINKPEPITPEAEQQATDIENEPKEGEQ